MWDNYPNPQASGLMRESSKIVKAEIGGQVGAEWIKNTCAIRLSHALNYAGAPIPKDAPGLNVVKGGDGKWYAYRVNEMRHYLESTYGPPTFNLESKAYDGMFNSDDDEMKKTLAGHRGIIMFDVPSFGKTATGHLDVWDGAQVRYSDEFVLAKRVLLWELGN